MVFGMKSVNEWYSQLAKALCLVLAIRRCFANIGGAYEPSDLVMLVSKPCPESCPDRNPLHLVHKRPVMSVGVMIFYVEHGLMSYIYICQDNYRLYSKPLMHL